MTNILSVYNNCEALPISQCATACSQGGKTSWQLLPRWANASLQAPQPSASYFKKGDGAPSSEFIIAIKNKQQPYFPVSLIYKGFSIAICLLVFY